MSDFKQNKHVCEAWVNRGYCVVCDVHYTDEMELRAARIDELEDKMNAIKAAIEEKQYGLAHLLTWNKKVIE
jgi:hypothetical protein